MKPRPFNHSFHVRPLPPRPLQLDLKLFFVALALVLELDGGVRGDADALARDLYVEPPSNATGRVLLEAFR